MRRLAIYIPLELRLAGQYYDTETGLHDNWHRTYNPETGRYLQPDPLGYRDRPDERIELTIDISQSQGTPTGEVPSIFRLPSDE
jgi:RHS repeat-associated protein